MNEREKGTEYELLSSDTTIGRADENSLTLTHGSLSKHHAQILCRDDGWHIEDLGSTNGVIVNDKQTSTPTLLAPGAHIQLGDVHILVMGDPVQTPIVNLDECDAPPPFAPPATPPPSTTAATPTATTISKSETFEK